MCLFHLKLDYNCKIGAQAFNSFLKLLSILLCQCALPAACECEQQADAINPTFEIVLFQQHGHLNLIQTWSHISIYILGICFSRVVLFEYIFENTLVLFIYLFLFQKCVLIYFLWIDFY